MPNYHKSSAARHLIALKTKLPKTLSERLLNQAQFKQVLPMTPKDKINIKGSQEKPKYECVEPMNIMLNCLKANDYSDSQCEKEITTFYKCFNQYKVDVSVAEENVRKGIYKVAQNSDNIPQRLAQKTIERHKTPRKVDSGRDVPVEQIPTIYQPKTKY